jgi:hypothetical protein
VSEFKDKIRELQLQRLRAVAGTVQRGNDYVPRKVDSKTRPYKMQDTFKKSLRGVPGGHWLNQASAPTTGCKTGPSIGLLASARNANTTQGSYNETVVE